MRKEFVISKEKKYVLYGVGGGAQRIKEFMTGTGYSLVGYVDQRAETLVSIGKLPVWSLDKFENIYEDKDHIIIIITIKNVFEHQAIAGQLVKRGYRNIIYKPRTTIQGSENEYDKTISDAHDYFLVHLEIPIEKEVYTSEVFLHSQYEEKLLINDENDDNVRAWMPVELLFNYKQFPEYYDFSMMVFHPMVDLYKSLLGQEKMSIDKSIENYIGYTSEWVNRNNLKMEDDFRKSLISSRLKIFSEMQKMSEVDSPFFVRNAPMVACDSKAIHFNLISSGRNRVSFLIAKQFKYVPVLMKRVDYYRWMNVDVYDKIIAYLNEKEVEKLFAPVPHPKLVNVTSKAVDYIRLFVAKVADRLYKLIYAKSYYENGDLRLVNAETLSAIKEDTKILVALSDNGCMSRNLSNMGFNITRIRTSGVTDFDEEITSLIDELFYVDAIRFVDIDFKSANAKVLIIDSSMPLIELVSIMSHEVNEVYLIEYDQGSEVKVYLDNAGFNHKKELFKTIWDDKYYVGTVFYR